EERLPLAAEEVVADFISHDGSALGVCARLDELRVLVDALESRGVSVQSVTPTALLAVQSLGDVGESLVLWGEGGHQVNLLSLRNGKPVAWSLLPADVEDLRPHLIAAEANAPDAPRIRAHAIDASLASAVGAEIVSDDSIETAASRVAADVTAGRLRPWIELRRGPLAAKDSLRRH